MDCSICTTMPFILRPPRNTICAACYEGARSLIALVNKFDGDNNNNNNNNNTTEKSVGSNLVSSNSSSKGFANVLKWVKEMKEMEEEGFANVLKWVKEMKEMEEEVDDKLRFLGGLEAAFRYQIHTDILIRPGNNGPPIPAHRALLAVKSEIFKNMLESDGCKEAPKEAITLSELNHEELQSLLEFLYNGSLSNDKVEKHVYSLTIAADKYEIPFLQKFCERQMLSTLSSSNALEILEISDVCSNLTLKETALNFIVKNMEDIVFSPRFESFALKNPHLSVQITRASMLDVKNKRNNAL